MKNKLLFTCACLLTSLFSLAAFAGECAFIEIPSFDFGSLSVTTRHASATGDVKFWCTKGTAYRITDNGGMHKSGYKLNMKSNDSRRAYIPYILKYNSNGIGLGKDVPMTVPVRINVFVVDRRSLVAGRYFDQVKLSLNY
ncbi:MAG: spore coat protein U domain-containing protein [Gammaproteobacteria bacterium]|nr:spore coat protein U domain-containing protein [Gammaproteobacteria bacterium]